MITYFKVQKNIIFERAHFNKRCQLPNESVEQFITEAHRIGDNCKFGVMKEELIRDRLVVGICDHALSEHLQIDRNGRGMFCGVFKANGWLFGFSLMVHFDGNTSIYHNI